MELSLAKPLKTYVNPRKLAQISPAKPIKVVPEANVPKKMPLTTKKAVELLIKGTLKFEVCRFCLEIVSPLSELDQILSIGGRGAIYEITIRDIVAAIHPFKVAGDPNFPNKICNKCLNKAIRSYLFAQQCEQAERALRNCFDDMFEKLEKLDPLERVNKRGRHKLNPNHNTLYTEHQIVMDYAEPIRNLINLGSVSYTNETSMSDLECKKCWQLLPNVESLANHEKTHLKTMWYHCRLCGKSFAKRIQLKKHAKHSHDTRVALPENDKFECKKCGFISDNHISHLQHIEKHKFQMVVEHMVERQMDKLCVVCYDKDKKLVELDKVIALHGGYPELTGERSLYNILGTTLPEMNMLTNYTGTKICEQCLDKAIISYIFINRTHYIRNRLDTCVSRMLENLNQIKEPQCKIFIEIAQNGILPATEDDYIDDLIKDIYEDIDESKLKVDVLEDEFRIKSESEDSETELGIKPSKNNLNLRKDDITPVANAATKVENITKLMNGYQSISSSNVDVCSEFLTFKKKRKPLRKVYKCKFTCLLCDKNFISSYFLKRHVLKHVNKKVECKICRYQFGSKFHLIEHMKITHLLNKIDYKSCTVCGRIFTDEHKMMKHQKNHKLKECQLCSKMFETQKHYDSHLQRHAVKFNIYKQRKVQACSFCEKECLNDNKLSVHVNKVHLLIKPYSCDMCERQFYTESNLQSHKKIHSLFSKETCAFCNKTLKSRRDLVVHIRKHIDAKPYKCFICPQSFYSEIKVKNHMKKWHGGCFCCKLCKKVFVNKKGLRNHVNRAHSVF